MWPFELAVPQKTYVIHHFCKVSPIILWQFFIFIYTKQYGQGERRKWKRLEVEHNACSHEEWGFTTGETIILILQAPHVGTYSELCKTYINFTLLLLHTY